MTRRSTSATTGYQPNGWPVGRGTRAPGCATRPPRSRPPRARSLHTWINYTGCDSLYSAAADASTAYFGGHERWAYNPNGCDRAGTGAVAAPGFEGLSATTGALTFNPTRGRGLGADDMLVTTAGLWIASDNRTAPASARASQVTRASASCPTLNR